VYLFGDYVGSNGGTHWFPQRKGELIMPSENIEGVLEHKRQVAKHMQSVASDLFERAVVHDYSKFSPEEFDVFEEVTPLLKTLEYGSQEYKDMLAKMKPALDHHYQVNSHHPEYYTNGVNEMTLIDLIEMVCDWMAAVQRMKNGDINKSLVINKDRFGIDDQLYKIIVNTVARMEA
jgi:hypothetical protein